MRTTIRIPHSIYDALRRDLARPHPIAAERMGFAFARLGIAPVTERLLLVTDYAPIADEHYEDDPSAASTMNADAIRKVRQRLLDRSRESAIHVHTHEHAGRPRFSKIDIASQDEMIPSFRALAPEVPHGAIVFSDDSAAARVSVGGGGQPSANLSVVVVGYPLRVWRPREER